MASVQRSIGDREVVELYKGGHHAFLVPRETRASVVLLALTPCDVTVEIVVEEGAECALRILSLGGGTQTVRAHVTGRNGRSDIDWIAYLSGNERGELAATNIFEASEGRGEITMKGVAQGKAHLGMKGLIAIGEKGTGADAYLTQDVLMLDASAKVDAVPGLEIKTNDVKASHSATISRVTAEDLFYFASRGIGEEEAKRMFVLGFLGGVLAKMNDETLRERMTGLIEEKYKYKKTNQ